MLLVVISKQIKFVLYFIVFSLKKDKTFQSNCNDIKRKLEILERKKVLGFLSTTKPAGNCLEGMLFHVHLLLVSLYLSLKPLIELF